MGFFRKNFSTICLAISTIFLIFTFYKSHIVWDGERNYYYKLSYFIFGSFFLFSILSFFFSEKIKTYSVIIILSIVISFYLFEGYQNYLLISKIKNLEIKKQIQYKKLTGKK